MARTKQYQYHVSVPTRDVGGTNEKGGTTEVKGWLNPSKLKMSIQDIRSWMHAIGVRIIRKEIGIYGIKFNVLQFMGSRVNSFI